MYILLHFDDCLTVLNHENEIPRNLQLAFRPQNQNKRKTNLLTFLTINTCKRFHEKRVAATHCGITYANVHQKWLRRGNLQRTKKMRRNIVLISDSENIFMRSWVFFSISAFLRRGNVFPITGYLLYPADRTNNHITTDYEYTYKAMHLWALNLFKIFITCWIQCH